MVCFRPNKLEAIKVIIPKTAITGYHVSPAIASNLYKTYKEAEADAAEIRALMPGLAA